MGYDIDQYLEDIQGYPEEEPELARGPMCPRCGGDSCDMSGEYWACLECGHRFDDIEEEED